MTKVWNNVEELAAMPSLGMFAQGLRIAFVAWAATIVLVGVLMLLLGGTHATFDRGAGVVFATAAISLGFVTLMAQAPGTCRKKMTGWAVGQLICGSAWALVMHVV